MSFSKKISKTIDGILQICKNPWLLNVIINQNENWEKKTPDFYKKGFKQVSLDQLFPNFDGRLDTVAFLDGGSLITDLLLLKNACKEFEQCKYFEIGTWRGESIANLTDVAADLNTLDLDINDYKTYNFTKEYANAHGFFIRNNSKIKQHLGDSTKFNFAGLNKKFDVIFIDGNHHFDFVVSDTKNVFEHLIHENSIVIWHDYGFSPEDIRFEIVNAILKGVPKQFHDNLYHVENTMCAIYTLKNFDGNVLKLYDNPKRIFSVDLQIKVEQ